MKHLHRAILLVASILLTMGGNAGAQTQGKQTFIHGPRKAAEWSGEQAPAQRMAPARLTADGGLTIYGNLTNQKSWAYNHRGIYSIQATPGATAQVVIDNKYYANGGGTYIPDEHLYVTTSYTSVSGMAYDSRIRVFDTDTWETVRDEYIAPNAMSWDMCYNPQDGLIYGCFADDIYMSSFHFGALDYVTGKETAIAQLRIPYMVMVCTGEGVIYAIEAGSGDLYRITTDGERTLVGSTGVTPMYLQTATYDFRTKKMYWLAGTEKNSLLCTVDLETAELTTITDLTPTLDEWMAAFTLTPYAHDDAPDECLNVAMNFEGPATTGSVRFTLPQTTFGGQSLTGQLAYTISVDGEQVATGEGKAGQEQTVDVTVDEGYHRIAVAAQNAAGRGPLTLVRHFVGHDIPAAPQHVVVADNGNSRTISFDAVTTGAQGGYVEAANIRYTVTRLPDGKVVAEATDQTTVTDNEPLATLAKYSYSVIATEGERQGEAATSEGFLAGDPITAPYQSDFNSELQRNMYVIVNANGDEATWEPYSTSHGTVYRYRYDNSGNTGDDWLITPPVQMEAGQVYEIITTAETTGEDERLEIRAGLEPTAEAMTLEVTPATTLKHDVYGSSEHELKAYFIPSESGIYYLGFHAMSNPFAFYLLLDGWQMAEPFPATAPDAVTAMKVTPAAKGELKADVSFTAPTTDCYGNAIATIDRAIVRDSKGREVAVVENPVPGQTYTVTDEAPTQGTMSYQTVCANASGEGKIARAEAYVGLDRPGMVVKPTWEQDGMDAIISWQAPGEVGMHGGYVNPEELTYKVETFYPESDIIGNKFPDTYFVDDNMEFLTTQAYVYYAVQARNAAGTSTKAYTHAGPFGMPYELPFSESFATGAVRQGGWGVDNPNLMGSIDPYWSVKERGQNYSQLFPQDDGYMMLLNPGMGGNCILQTPMVDLTRAKQPVLTFYVSNPEATSKLQILVSTDNAATWTVAEKNVAHTEKGQWLFCEVPLDNFLGRPVCIGFKGITTQMGVPEIGLDNITVEDIAKGSGIDRADESLRIVADGSGISLTGWQGRVEVYGLNGQLVAAANVTPQSGSHGEALRLPLRPGIYMVKAGTQVRKIAVR